MVAPAFGLDNLARKIALIFVLAITGCVSSQPTPMYWDHEASKAIGSSSVFIFSELDDIDRGYRHHGSMGGILGGVAGLGGAILGTLIDSAGADTASSVTESELVSQTRQQLYGFSMTEELLKSLDKPDTMPSWLNVQNIAITDIEHKEVNIKSILENESSNTDVLITIRPSYYFTSDLSSLFVKSELQIYPKIDSLLDLRGATLGANSSTIYYLVAMRRYAVPVDKGSAQKNAASWLESGSYIYDSLNQAVDEMSDEMVAALQRPFPIEVKVP